MMGRGLLLASVALASAAAVAYAADPVPPYNPFVGASVPGQIDGRAAAPGPALPAAVMPLPPPPPPVSLQPNQPRQPPPRDLTVVAAHGRMAILRTQTSRYPVKDGEVVSVEAVRYTAHVQNGTVRLVEAESGAVAFVGYVGAGISPEQRNPRRQGQGGNPMTPPPGFTQPQPQPQRPLQALPPLQQTPARP